VEDLVLPEYNPYPTNIQQTVIQPLNDPSHMAEQNIEPTPVAPVAKKQEEPKPAQSSVTTSDTPVSADIMNLVNNAEGLSIATVAHEANRIHKKLEDASEEVVISLR